MYPEKSSDPPYAEAGERRDARVPGGVAMIFFGEAAAAGSTLPLRFFDQRPDFGTGVRDRAWAEATWERIIASVRPKP